MKAIRHFVVAAALAASTLGAVAHAAPAADPLFVSLTSDDKHRVEMSIAIGEAQMEKGHAFTLFLTDRSVQIASSQFAPKFAKQQKMLEHAIDGGAKVLVCAGCMKHFGIDSANLLPGIEVSNPDKIEAALFQPHTRTLAW